MDWDIKSLLGYQVTARGLEEKKNLKVSSMARTMWFGLLPVSVSVCSVDVIQKSTRRFTNREVSIFLSQIEFLLALHEPISFNVPDLWENHYCAVEFCVC